MDVSAHHYQNTALTYTKTCLDRRHVYADLRAYECTSKECSMVLFEDRESWIAHEMEKHRRAWFCRDCTFESRDFAHLIRHIRRYHNAAISDEEINVLSLVSSKPLDDIDLDHCQLCDNSKAANKGSTYSSGPKSPYQRFMKHLASHQQQLALFAIPRESPVNDLDSDRSGGSSHALRGSMESASSKSQKSSLGSQWSSEEPVAADATSERDRPATLSDAVETKVEPPSERPFEEELPTNDEQATSILSDIDSAFPIPPKAMDTLTAWLAVSEPGPGPKEP